MELPNRVQLEAKLGRRIQRLNNRHLRELLALLGNPPDFNNVTDEFWQRVRRENEEETAALLLLLYSSSAITHIKVGGADPKDSEDLINAEAEGFAATRSRAIGERQAAEAAKRFQNAAERVQQAAGTEAIRKSDVLKETGPIFSPSEAINITRDETTRARHQGAERGVQITTGISENDLWQNRPSLSRTGPCPICEPLDNKPRSVWSLLFPEGPPSPHPGCVCVIEYAFERAKEPELVQAGS